MSGLNIFRAKGLLWFKNYDSRFIFHRSGSRFDVEEDEWPEGVKPSNQLVVIGRKMDEKKIKEMLQDCVTKPDDPEDEDEFGYGYDDDEEEDIYGVGPGAQGTAVGQTMRLTVNRCSSLKLSSLIRILQLASNSPSGGLSTQDNSSRRHIARHELLNSPSALTRSSP